MADTLIPDGSFDFSGGVDSGKVPTIQSELTPNGLRRNQLAWLNNATVRGGGITQRNGWTNLAAVLAGGLYQSGYMYAPDVGSPYLIISVSGRIYQVTCEAPFFVTDLSALFGLVNPANVDQGFMEQGEQFLIIQAGDGVTLPLFWDGNTLRRSVGIISPNNIPGAYPLGQLPYNELPAATCMDYYQNRMWYAQGRTYAAGDIVSSRASGSALYDYRDSILKVTENPLAIGGDNFSVPSNAGNIRALKHSTNLNTQLGQGNLYIFTRKNVYFLEVPITRASWIGTTSQNGPLQGIAQTVNGSVNDRCVVPVNGDLYYQSLAPDIRALFIAIRNFQQPGNIPISNNENRALQFNDRALMRFSSGIEFDNRLWQAITPKIATDGINVVSQGLAILDFDLISSLDATLPPAWEGFWQGIQILQMFTGDFGGLQRAFGLAISELDNSIRLWEFTTDLRFDLRNGQDETRVEWSPEFPAMTWGKEFKLKNLKGAEFWLDKIFGTVELTFYYRPDSSPCWIKWHATEVCTAKNCQESISEPCSYPPEGFREGYKETIPLPTPPSQCDPMRTRATDLAYQFQVKVEVKGWCRIRGFLLYAELKDKSIYDGLNC